MLTLGHLQLQLNKLDEIAEEAKKLSDVEALAKIIPEILHQIEKGKTAVKESTGRVFKEALGDTIRCEETETEIILKAWKKLRPWEQQVLDLLYGIKSGNKWTEKQIANGYKSNTAKVSRTACRALKKIRDYTSQSNVTSLPKGERK